MHYATYMYEVHLKSLKKSKPVNVLDFEFKYVNISRNCYVKKVALGKVCNLKFQSGD